MGKDHLLEQYQEELKRTDADLLTAEDQFKIIAERKDDLIRDKNSLTQLIASRKKKLGIVNNETTDPVTAPASSKVGVGNDPAISASLPTAGKSAFVWKLVLTRPGVTPSEIRKAAQGKFELKKNFPYTILHGWKKSGRVEERGGQYFAKHRTFV